MSEMKTCIECGWPLPCDCEEEDERLVAMKAERDKWRAVAEQACGHLKKCLPDVPMGTSKTLAAYEALKK
jgi:hypothetical protein